MSEDSFLRRREIAATVIRELTWRTTTFGVCECPGSHLHTTGGKEAYVRIDGFPRLKCYHHHCAELVEEAAKELRKRIWSGEPRSHFKHQWTEADQERAKFQAQLQQVEAQAAKELKAVLRERSDLRQLGDRSPVRIAWREEDDWKHLLSIFDQQHRIWIGEKLETGHEWNARNFRLVAEWLNCRRAPGHLVCPSHFLPGTFSRSKASATKRLFLIVESDVLNLSAQATLLMHLAKSWKLRAVVYSGSKSLHGWFEPPPDWSDARREICKATLRGYQCDPSGVEAQQPCRLPGIIRPETCRWQKLCYLDPNP